MKNTFAAAMIAMAMMLNLVSCQQDFLEEKPRKSLLVPTSLQDFQALLDNGFQLMSTAPYYSILADGDFVLTDAYLFTQSDLNRYIYTWDSQTVRTLPDWDTPYKQVFTCNVVLEGLAKISGAQAATPEYNAIKGAALFHRSMAFFQLAQQFAPAYSRSGDNSGQGIVLPLTADVNQMLPRSTVEQTYRQIAEDLNQATGLLPTVAAFLSRPGKAAAYALLARLHLASQDYPSALASAQACLDIKSGLLDYNKIAAGQPVSFPLPFSQVNPEVILFSEMSSSMLGNPAVTVDSSLYESYQQADLRRTLFFTAGLNFKGSYTGTIYPFAGIATDEVYLVKAECLARLGQTADAMLVLNLLLKNRWETARFRELSATSGKKALDLILSERRKQLLGRGTRWMDLKRLNQDPETAVTLTRKIAGETISLAPGSARYQFKIPEDQISFGVVTQNP